jgi:putative spermidine/putrescine transport system substrate-binding protein
MHREKDQTDNLGSFTMRTTLTSLLAAGLGTALLLSGTPAPAAEINMMSWGGHYLDTFRPVADAFEKETGHKVNIVVMSGAKDGLTKITAQKNDPQVDVWLSIESTAQAAADAGLLAELKPELVPNLKALPKEMVGKHFVTLSQSPRGIAYRKDLVPFPIKDWSDLWDPRLKSKVGMSFVIDTGSPLVMAALINGGSEKNIEPGFAKMKALKPNLAGFFKTDSESVKFLESGEFAVIGYSILANFYLKLGPDSNIKFVMPEKPKFLAPIPAAVVKGRGAEREKAAHELVNFMLSPKQQEWITGRFGQVPSNPNAKLPAALNEVIPSMPLTNVYRIDWETVNKNYADWNKRWNQEIQTN